MGAKIPRGVLLVGAGRSLRKNCSLARAGAGEANVPFYVGCQVLNFGGNVCGQLALARRARLVCNCKKICPIYNFFDDA